MTGYQNQQSQTQQRSPSLSALLQAASQRELKEKELSNRLNILEKLIVSHGEQLKKLRLKHSELVTEKKNKIALLDECKSQRNTLENSLSNTQSSRVNLEQVYMTTKSELDLIAKNNDDQKKHQMETIRTYGHSCEAFKNNCHKLKSSILQLIQTSGKFSKDTAT